MCLNNCFFKFKNRMQSIKKNEQGQILVFTALIAFSLILMVASIYNIGITIGEKMTTQNVADATAYSQAVMEARVLNLVAYTNRAIISHMVMIAFCTACYSQEKLWLRIHLFSAATAGVPVVGKFLFVASKVIHRMWYGIKFVARIARKAAGIWIKSCKIYQGLMIGECFTKIANGAIARSIAKTIDAEIDINQGKGTALNLINANNFRKAVGLLPSKLTFPSIRDVLWESCDGFSRGTSMPRTFHIKIPGPVWGGYIAKFGPTGQLRINKDNIEQSEQFRFKALPYPHWTWDNFKPKVETRWIWDTGFSIATEKYNDLKMGDQKFYVYRNKEESSFSTWILAKKSSDKIRNKQIPISGLLTSDDISALSKAEVFYYDPNTSRNRLGPNLFNPFWRARLAKSNINSHNLAFLQ